MNKTQEKIHQTSRRFQVYLRQVVISKVILIVVISIVAFTATHLGVIFFFNISNGYKHLDKLEQSLRLVETSTREFVSAENTKHLVLKILQYPTKTAIDKLRNAHLIYEENCGVESSILITSPDGDVVYTTISEPQLSNYFIGYNNAVCYNVKNTGKDEVYRAVYFDQTSYTDVMYVQPIYDEGVIRGYLTLLVSGTSWNYKLSVYNHDGIITDMRRNAMYVSKPGLLDVGVKYNGKNWGVWKSIVGRFWVNSRRIPEFSAVVYSLVYYPTNNVLWIGMVVILLMGIAWYKVAMDINQIMAEKNASSIEKLLSEVNNVQNNHEYRIKMNTGDEFEEVGHQINEMLENIMYLNKRNTELIQLNNKIEIQQLTAQINPHFLYNTLETIRNLVLFDPDKAEELILNLTDILRYSIDTSQNEVLLIEDMEYLYRYLDIQSSRFGDRLKYSIELTPECNKCYVPKLLIQPIIENSIKYGFKNKMELNIQVTGKVEDNILKICVADDGMGMPEDKAKILEQQLLSSDSQSESIGLRNLSRRLYLKYGAKSGLRIHNNEGIGFTVFINVEQKPRSGVKCTK